MSETNVRASATQLGLGVGVVLFQLLFVAACASNGDATAEPAPLSSAQVATIEAAVAERLGKGLATGYSIAVWRDGRVIYDAGFGARDEQGSSVTTSTVFQIGSDAKKITAMGLLQRVDAGELALTQSVADAVPGLELAADPSYFESVTLDDLLSQRTGLYDYTPWVDRPRDSDLRGVASRLFAENEPVMMPAGIAFNYSNPNYALAGLAYETAVGLPWADAVDRDIFEPLKMQHTYARRADVLAAESDIASGHGAVLAGDFDPFDSPADEEEPEPQTGWVDPSAQPDDAFMRPAGLVWSTAADQARLLGFLIDGDPTVLSDGLRSQLLAAQAPWYNHVDLRSYGYGVMIDAYFRGPADRFYAVPSYSHGGATPTMTSSSAWLPEQRVAVSILANGSQEDLDGLAAAVLEAAAEGRLPAPSTPKDLPAPTDVGSYAGTYTEPSLGELTLTWDEDALSVDIPTLNELGIDYEREPVALARDLFVFEVDQAFYVVSFYDDADGNPHRYGVHRDFVLTRTVP